MRVHSPRRTLLVALAALLVGTAASAAPGYLGVTVQAVDDDLREAMSLESEGGVLIAHVVEDGPASQAGLRDGDVVLSIDGRELDSPRALVRAVRDADAGDVLRVELVRDGDRRTVEVTIGEREDLPEDEDGTTWFRGPGGRHLDIRPHRWFGGNPPALERIEHFFGRPRLGVETRQLDESLARYFDVKPDEGVLVLEVMEETPAAEAGLQTGDIITHLAGTAVDSPGELRDLILDHEGDAVTLRIVRHGERMDVDVTLDEPEVRRTPRLSFFEGGDGPLREELDGLREELNALKEELRSLREDR